MKQMNAPMVSIVVPVYNVDRYLETCLNSICNQTLRDIEIICIDDGSTDDSFKILQSFSEKDSRFKIYRQSNKGVSSARNKGIEYAKGKYIIFIDGDDWIGSSMLYEMVDVAEYNDRDVVICSSDVCVATGTMRTRKIRTLTKNLQTTDEVWHSDGTVNDKWELLKKKCSWPFVWNKLIRKELLDTNNITFSEELSLGEDGVFLQILFQYVESIQFMQDIYYHYRYQREDSAMVILAQDNRLRFSKHIAIVDELLKELERRNLLENNAKQALIWIIKFLYGDYLSLSGEMRAESSRYLLSILRKYNLLGKLDDLTNIEKDRLKNLISAVSEDSELKRIFDWLLFKSQNIILRLKH